jgi:hypothetical protein
MEEPELVLELERERSLYLSWHAGTEHIPGMPMPQQHLAGRGVHSSIWLGGGIN